MCGSPENGNFGGLIEVFEYTTVERKVPSKKLVFSGGEVQVKMELLPYSIPNRVKVVAHLRKSDDIRKRLDREL